MFERILGFEMSYKGYFKMMFAILILMITFKKEE